MRERVISAFFLCKEYHLGDLVIQALKDLNLKVCGGVHLHLWAFRRVAEKIKSLAGSGSPMTFRPLPKGI